MGCAPELTRRTRSQELTEIGFRSFSKAIHDNTICLFANHSGFWKYPDFVTEKSEEERSGFRIPKLYGSCPYPRVLLCRLHPRNVARAVSATGVEKLRQTVVSRGDMPV